MSERPWLEVSDPSLRVERELLRRLNAEQPPSGSVDHGWSALSAEIAGLSAIGAAGAAADAAHGAAHAASAAGVGIAAKVVSGVALAGGLLWGGAQLLKTDETLVLRPQPSHQALPSRAAVLEPMPSSNTVEADPLPKLEPPAPPGRSAPSTTTLAEEGRLLAKARQLVQAGQAHEALRVLRSSESRYPRSVLFQEREVLTIEALGASGSSAAARQRAQRFLKRYPSSAHAGRLQRFVE